MTATQRVDVGRLPSPHWARDLHGETEVFTTEEVADLLQQLADYQRERAELYDRLNGTPCAEIRWLQEREQLMGELLSLRNARDAGADLDNDDLRDDAGFWFNVAAFRGIELTRQVERAEAAERAREGAHKELDSARHEIAGLSPNGYADSYVARIAAFLAANGGDGNA